MKLENDEVEPESGLVDEIVHVGLVAAVVIAAEEAAPALDRENPMGEMDRADAAETAAGENMPRGPIDAGEDDEFEREPKRAGLNRAYRGVLVGDVVILSKAKLRHPCGVIGVFDDRIAELAPPAVR